MNLLRRLFTGTPKEGTSLVEVFPEEQARLRPYLAGPKVGDWAWYRGFLMQVVRVRDGKVTLEGARYEVTVARADIRFSESTDLWFLPGLEGHFPRQLHGTIMAPIPPESRYKHHQNQQRLLVPLDELKRGFKILTKKELRGKNG